MRNIETVQKNGRMYIRQKFGYNKIIGLKNVSKINSDKKKKNNTGGVGGDERLIQETDLFRQWREKVEKEK